MGRTTTLPLPSVARALAALGENVRLARLRRQLSAELVAERAGMSRATLRAIERGDPGVSIGAYANALHTLGLEADLQEVGRADVLGRRLQDAGLPMGKRAPRRKVRDEG